MDSEEEIQNRWVRPSSAAFDLDQRTRSSASEDSGRPHSAIQRPKSAKFRERDDQRQVAWNSEPIIGVIPDKGKVQFADCSVQTGRELMAYYNQVTTVYSFNLEC